MVICEQDGIRTERIATLEKDFGSAGFDFEVSDRIVTDMWHKWVFIATVTAITSLMRGSVGEIAAVPGGTEFAKATLAERRRWPAQLAFR